MRSNIIDRILSGMSPERQAELEREFLEEYANNRWLEEMGKEWGTSTSVTLDILKAEGFNPIGICWYDGEETLIFKTNREANSAYKKLEKEQKKVFAYWYSKKDFEKEVSENNKIYEPIGLEWL